MTKCFYIICVYLTAVVMVKARTTPPSGPYMSRSVNMGCHHDDTIEGLKVFVVINAREQILNKIC